MPLMNARSTLLPGLLAAFVAAALYHGCGGEETPSPGPSPVAPEAAPKAPEAPWFTEEAEQRGITLLNGSGRPRHKELIMEAVGPGAAILDANADGLLDAFIPNGNWLVGPLREEFYTGEDRPRSALYIQRPDGTFRNEAKERGVEDDAWGFGACAADLDNDGDEDLVVGNLGPNRLYVNDGTGRFTDVAAKAGVAGAVERGQWEWSTGIAAGDYDRDGVLDLYVANYADMFKWMREAPDVERNPDGSIRNARVCSWQHLKVYCGPKGLPGQEDHLYRGLGGRDGEMRFQDVTKESGVWRGEGRKTSAPKRAMSNRAALIDIISIAQHARPNDIGQSDDLRAQFTAWSSLVKIKPSKPEDPLFAMSELSINLHYATLSAA